MEPFVCTYKLVETTSTVSFGRLSSIVTSGLVTRSSIPSSLFHSHSPRVLFLTGLVVLGLSRPYSLVSKKGKPTLTLGQKVGKVVGDLKMLKDVKR